jgi:DNA-binding XRE family transcriptional regulator
MPRKTDFMAWLFGELKTDRGLSRKADAVVAGMKIERQLVALRELRGLSQGAVAKLVGATEPYVAKLEAGQVRNPGVKTLVKYATALGGRVTVLVEPAPRQGAGPAHRRPRAEAEGEPRPGGGRESPPER